MQNGRPDRGPTGLATVVACVLLWALTAASAYADRNLTLEERESLHEHEQTFLLFASSPTTVPRILEEREHQCIQAFSHDAFCQCLTSKLDTTVSFEDYIVAVTTSAKQLHLKNLSEEDRRVIEEVRFAREQCVILVDDTAPSVQ